MARPKTNRLVVFYRVFVQKGDFAGAVANVKAKAASSLSQAANRPATPFVNVSGHKFNTISATISASGEEVNAVVQNEPVDWVDADTVGLFA